MPWPLMMSNSPIKTHSWECFGSLLARPGQALAAALLLRTGHHRHLTGNAEAPLLMRAAGPVCTVCMSGYCSVCSPAVRCAQCESMLSLRWRTQEATPRIKGGLRCRGVCVQSGTGTTFPQTFSKMLNSRLSFSASDACRVPFLAELGDGTPVQC